MSKFHKNPLIEFDQGFIFGLVMYIGVKFYSIVPQQAVLSHDSSLLLWH